ncbi:MAG: MFS transporter [Chloroflexi bacterium]|nr:MFS transporter [Chloroflexota bacterium]MBI4197630.1 MFS transporter [Chloroflexota bacterium]
MATLSSKVSALWPRFAEALFVKDFRRFMLAMFFFTGALHIGGTAQGWLVFDLTGSSFALGVIQSLFSTMIFLFSPLGGVLADRVDRKVVVLLTWAGAGLIVGVLALLILTDRIQMWHLLAASVAQGLVFSFNITSRFALVSQMVRDGVLKNAMVLVALTFNLNGLLFPLIGGLLIDLTGVGGAYLAITALYGMAVLLVTRVPQQGVFPREDRTSLLKEFVVGVRYLKGQPALLGLMGMALAAVALGQPYAVLLPELAARTLKVPASGLGLLYAMVGLGGMFGNLVLAGLSSGVRLGRLVVSMSVAAGLGLACLAVTNSLLVGVIVLFSLGFLGLPAFTILESLLQRHTPPEMRGRIMSLYMMVWGLFPVGVLLSSALADAVGLWLPLLIDGLGLAAVSLAVMRLFPGLLHLTSREDPVLTRPPLT